MEIVASSEEFKFNVYCDYITLQNYFKSSFAVELSILVEFLDFLSAKSNCMCSS
jgi:hypothetical protein